MRPEVFVYAVMLDPEKMASYTEASKAFDYERLNAHYECFMEAAKNDNRGDVGMDLVVFYDPTAGHKRPALATKIPGWYSIKFGELVLYWPGPDSSLWREIGQVEFYEPFKTMPTPFEIILERPDLLNVGIQPNADFGISLTYDMSTEFIYVVSLCPLPGLPLKSSIKRFDQTLQH